MDAIDALIQEFRTQVLERQVALSRDPQTRPQALALLDGPYMTRIAAGIAELNGALNMAVAHDRRALDAATVFYQRVLLVGSLGAILLAIGLWWSLSRSIAAPVVAMTAAMGRLAAGDRDVIIPETGRRDEIGAMAAAVQTFKTAAIETAQLEAQAVEQQARADSARSEAEAERAAAAETQVQVVSAVARGWRGCPPGIWFTGWIRPSPPNTKRCARISTPPCRSCRKRCGSSSAAPAASARAPGKSPRPPTTCPAAPSSRPPAWSRPPQPSTRSPPPSARPPRARTRRVRSWPSPRWTPSIPARWCATPSQP